MRRRAWWREQWPKDAPQDPRFDGYDHAVAELWLDDALAGYAYVLILQAVARVGPPWRPTLRHDSWNPEVHFALRPTPEGAIAAHEIGDSWYAIGDKMLEDFYQQLVAHRRVTWEGTEYRVRWLDDPHARQDVIDQYFWEYEDLTK